MTKNRNQVVQMHWVFTLLDQLYDNNYNLTFATKPPFHIHALGAIYKSNGGQIQA